jgi:hypothetical protein
MSERVRSAKTSKGNAAVATGAAHSAVDESHYSGQSTVGVIVENPEADSAPCDSRDEIAMVRRATEVLGVDHVANWMRSRIPSLGNQTPYALLQTEDGRNQVECVLLKIEHGVY